jgi:hypothetical protein
MSTHSIRTLIPALVATPRGADWAATAAAMLWIAARTAITALRGGGRHPHGNATLAVSKSHG